MKLITLLASMMLASSFAMAEGAPAASTDAAGTMKQEETTKTETKTEKKSEKKHKGHKKAKKDEASK